MAEQREGSSGRKLRLEVTRQPRDFFKNWDAPAREFFLACFAQPAQISQRIEASKAFHALRALEPDLDAESIENVKRALENWLLDREPMPPVPDRSGSQGRAAPRPPISELPPRERAKFRTWARNAADLAERWRELTGRPIHDLNDAIAVAEGRAKSAAQAKKDWAALERNATEYWRSGPPAAPPNVGGRKLDPRTPLMVELDGLLEPLRPLQRHPLIAKLMAELCDLGPLSGDQIRARINAVRYRAKR